MVAIVVVLYCEVAVFNIAQNIVYEVASKRSKQGLYRHTLTLPPPELGHAMLRIAMQTKGELGCVQGSVEAGGVGRSE